MLSPYYQQREIIDLFFFQLAYVPNYLFILSGAPFSVDALVYQVELRQNTKQAVKHFIHLQENYRIEVTQGRSDETVFTIA
jgi:hypothetical protein